MVAAGEGLVAQVHEPDGRHSDRLRGGGLSRRLHVGLPPGPDRRLGEGYPRQGHPLLARVQPHPDPRRPGGDPRLEHRRPPHRLLLRR